MSGTIYAIYVGKKRTRIGFTTNLDRRLREHRNYYGCAVLLYSRDGTKNDETDAHEAFRHWRIDSIYHREEFELTPANVADILVAQEESIA